ncbi:AraC-like ligand-binding domain-containing protein [Streptomyces termitum]
MNPEDLADVPFGSVSSGRQNGLLVTTSSAVVQAEDRFGWFSDQIRQYVLPIALSTSYAANFRARISALQLGAALVVQCSFPPLEAARTARHIRQDDPETYQLGWIRRSSMRVSQLRGDAFVGTDDMVLFDTSHPLEAGVPSEEGMAEVTVLRIPRNALSLPAAHADRLLSLRLAPGGVSGALMRRHLDTLITHASEIGQAEAHRLGTVTTDLAASFIADRLSASQLLSQESRTTALRAKINAFISDHLGDPDLGPAGIAAHHHISLRSLHTLFSHEPTTVAATIRHRRLECCRADLADPRMRNQSIAALAARWGLLVPAEFSRAFRAAYGMSPREYRAEATRPHSSARNHKQPGTHPQSGSPARPHADSPGPETA